MANHNVVLHHCATCGLDKPARNFSYKAKSCHACNRSARAAKRRVDPKIAIRTERVKRLRESRKVALAAPKPDVVYQDKNPFEWRTFRYDWFAHYKEQALE